MKLGDFPDLSEFPNVLRQLGNQLVYIMFVTNNWALFHLWWKEDLVKHQKVSKYYEKDCLQNFLMLFMSLLTASIVKTVKFRMEFTLSF